MDKKPKIWISVLMAAVLVAALNFVFPKNADKYLGELFWTKKTFAPAQYDVVILGDSRVYRGLSPKILEAHLPGKKVLNFAYSNGGLNPTMFEAGEQKLSSGAKAKVIVVGISANTITGYSAGNKQYLQELNRPREEIIERMYLNPVRYWFSATSPEKLKQHFSKDEETSYYRHKYHMNGYVESEKFPIDTTEALSSYTDDFTNFKVESNNLKLLFDQVEMWTNNGIIVVGFIPPVSMPMQTLEDTLGLFDPVVIKSGFEKASGHWIDINPNEFETYDGSHLIIESAKQLSNNIGEELATLIEMAETKNED